MEARYHLVPGKMLVCADMAMDSPTFLSRVVNMLVKYLSVNYSSQWNLTSILIIKKESTKLQNPSNWQANIKNSGSHCIWAHYSKRNWAQKASVPLLQNNVGSDLASAPHPQAQPVTSAGCCSNHRQHLKSWGSCVLFCLFTSEVSTEEDVTQICKEEGHLYFEI